MIAFWYSTVTLGAEIVITAIIMFVFYSGYKRKLFPKKLAVVALAYEVLFNISYMVYRAIEHVTNEPGSEPVVQTVLAIVHGALSLVMFIALIVFFVLAWRAYSKKVNYFKVHSRLTATFIVLWLLAVLSGIAFYFALYVF